MNVVSSEKTIGVSIGTAQVLGLSPMSCDSPPTTAYLLLGARCTSDCAFCAQARSGQARTDGLSRVTWPQHDQETTLDALQESAAAGRIARACLQVTAGPSSLTETAGLVSAIRGRSAVPVCAAVLPRSLRDVDRLMAAGADVVGFGLDAATPSVYERVKTPGCTPGQGQRAWLRQMALIEASSRQYPMRIGVHVIVGLGETERDVAELTQRLADAKAIIALFAFTPVRGTAMDNEAPPALEVYRRCQAARHLIVTGTAKVERFTYDVSGRITHFGLPRTELRQALADGQAFRTSGCPACNRPYYNERPRGVMYNYPRPLDTDEIEAALKLLGL